MFQSPSLRGSGRFGVTPATTTATCPLVSIPFIAGQWSLQHHRRPSIRHARVSIPFIAGQWSLPNRRVDAAGRGGHRVSIPFIAGQWSLQTLARLRSDAAQVSIPFIAGQWSLLGSAPCPTSLRRGSQSPSLRGSGRFASIGQSLTQ